MLHYFTVVCFLILLNAADLGYWIWSSVTLNSKYNIPRLLPRNTHCYNEWVNLLYRIFHGTYLYNSSKSLWTTSVDINIQYIFSSLLFS